MWRSGTPGKGGGAGAELCVAVGLVRVVDMMAPFGCIIAQMFYTVKLETTEALKALRALKG